MNLITKIKEAWHIDKVDQSAITNIQKMIEESKQNTEEIRKLTIELNEKQKLINDILNTAPSLIYVFDLVNKRNVWTNKNFTGFMGYTKQDLDDMKSNQLTTLFHPDDYQYYINEVYPKYFKLKNGESLVYIARFKHKTEEEWKYLKATVVVFKRDENGSPIQVLGNMLDLTNEFKIMKELKFKSAALDAAANGIIITDSDGKIVFANDSFLKESGFTLSELIGQNPRIFKSGKHTKTFYKKMWDKISSGNVWQGNITNKYKNNKIITSKTTITPVFNGKINYYIAIKELI